jgi:hypothetical protein
MSFPSDIQAQLARLIAELNWRPGAALSRSVTSG